MIGDINLDLFIKNIILNVNQAISECIIEKYIKYIFSQKNLLQNIYSIKSAVISTPIGNSEENKQEDLLKKEKNQTSISRHIEQLEQIFK